MSLPLPFIFLRLGPRLTTRASVPARFLLGCARARPRASTSTHTVTRASSLFRWRSSSACASFARAAASPPRGSPRLASPVSSRLAWLGLARPGLAAPRLASLSPRSRLTTPMYAMSLNRKNWTDPPVPTALGAGAGPLWSRINNCREPRDRRRKKSGRSGAPATSFSRLGCFPCPSDWVRWGERESRALRRLLECESSALRPAPLRRR